MPATMHYNKAAQSTGNKMGVPLNEQIARAVKSYYDNLGDQTPENVYELVLNEIELPLLKETMNYCRHNQSLAARILGINRGTFRKKLAFYGML